MAYLQLNDRQIQLRTGDTTIGASAGVDIVVEGAAADGPAAVVVAAATGVVIRQGTTSAAVKVNGVALGVEPVPLIHGDRVEVGSATLIFGDAAKGGSTAFFSGANLAELLRQREGQAAPGAAAPATRAPTANTGGRLVSLVDGREYAIVSKPFTIGRDPACDVVIASGDVSRTHAEIESGADGYYLIDTSTNGLAVNGARVDGTLTLARGDVIRVGPEEFRFYADKLPAAAPAPIAAPVVDIAPAAAAVAISATAPEAAAPVAAARPALAHVELQGAKGPLSFPIVELMAQLGRGAHNDLVVREDSISDSHAKFQRRNDGWYVVDMQSTNGTFVGGVRVQGEAALGESAEIKFGAVKGMFRVAGAAPAHSGKGETAVLSSALAAQMVQQAKAASVAPAPVAPAVPVVPVAPPAAVEPPAPGLVATPASSGGVPTWVWLVVVILIAGGAYFFLQGR